MQTPPHRPYHQQSRRAKSIDQMFSADASKVQVSVAGQLSGIDNRLAQNVHYLLIGKFLAGLAEQHVRCHLDRGLLRSTGIPPDVVWPGPGGFRITT
jgi:hypothetical protein